MGGLKKIVLPGGRSLSLTPQRCICRQSNFGDANRSGRRLDVAGLFAVEDTNRNSRCRRAPFLDRMHWTTDDRAVPEKTVKVRENRRVGGGSELAQRGIGLVGNACCIDVHQMPEDGAVRWKIGCVLQDVFERQLVIPFEFDPPGQWRDFPLQLPLPKSFIGRNPIHDGDRLCVRAGRAGWCSKEAGKS